MNKPVAARVARSVCPHDCPSTCALDVETIGKAVSSGCVRLMAQDVIDLYERVPNGSPIIVRQ